MLHLGKVNRHESHWKVKIYGDKKPTFKKLSWKILLSFYEMYSFILGCFIPAVISQIFSISLKANNGKYVSVVERSGGILNIEASESHHNVTTRFQVHIIDTNHVYLKSIHNKYLSLIYRGGVNAIEATKSSPDNFCKFKVHQISPNDSLPSS